MGLIKRLMGGGKGSTRSATNGPVSHEHFVVTCGACEGDFSICGAAGLPCFAWCPHCNCRITLWEG